MYSFKDLHVGHTNDDNPKVIVGILETSAAMTLYETARYITNLKAIYRKLKRQSWRSTDED
jgi:hypothetical protein